MILLVVMSGETCQAGTGFTDYVHMGVSVVTLLSFAYQWDCTDKSKCSGAETVAIYAEKKKWHKALSHHLPPNQNLSYPPDQLCLKQYHMLLSYQS